MTDDDTDRTVDLSQPIVLTDPVAAATDQTVADDGTVTIHVGEQHAGETVDVAASRVCEELVDDDRLRADGGEVRMPEVSQARRRTEREQIGEHPHLDSLTRGTVIEYDDWQWAVVTEIVVDEDPTMVGFVLLDKLSDSIIRTLESAWGCWEHYEVVEPYRGGEHERWADAEYIMGDDIWAVLGPIHPDARGEREGREEVAEADE